MSFRGFEDKAKNDPSYIQLRLSSQSGYDKHGHVFAFARPLTGSVTYPVRTFRDTKALEQFIAEFTFFRYRGTCPSWRSVLLSSNHFSEEEAFSGTLKGKTYTPEVGKAYVTQLLASGELVAHNMDSWVPGKDRNHHLPWPKPKPSVEEEFLPVTPPRFSLGPHDEPGYAPPPTKPPEDKTAGNDDASLIITTAGSSEETSTTLDEEIVSDKTPPDLNAKATQDVSSVTAPIDFDGHILSGEVKPNGSVVGGHSIANGNVRVISGTQSPPNAQGVYTAQIEVPDPANPGQFLRKTNNGGMSTMFPDAWTADRVKVEVDVAFQNKVVSGNKWTGVTPSGVTVEGWLTPKTTVYPKY